MRAIRWISGVRTRFLTIIFVLAMLCCPMQRTQAAGMPVIDIESILTSINNFMTEVQHINREINKWTAEATRVATAAKALSEGDWRNGIEGLLSAATSITGNIEGYIGTTIGMETMQAINSLWDTGMGVIDLYNSTMAGLDRVLENGDRIQDMMDEGASGFDIFNEVMGGISDSSSFLFNTINRATDAIVTNTLITTGKFAAAVNEGAGTAEKVQKYNEQIENNNQEIAKKTQEMMNALQNGETTTAEQLKIDIENLKEQNDNLLAAIEGEAQKLAWAIDAEDQMTLARANAAKAVSERMFQSYQNRVTSAMEKAAGSEENWISFLEELSKQLPSAGGGSIDKNLDLQIENLNLYFEMRADWEEEGSSSNNGN